MPLDQPIYLDNHATTRVDPRVVEAMLPYFLEHYGNAASTTHAFGADAREAVETARENLARMIGAAPRELIFTSGATESNNLAIRGICERQRRRGSHLVTVTTEHKAVLDPIERLGRRGFDVTLLPVAEAGQPTCGLIDVDRLAGAIRGDTLLVSIMLANNEIGVLQPIREISHICHERGALLHCDATQAVGKLPVDVDLLGVDLMSFTAHKLHGPKGIGALYVRRGEPIIKLECQIAGGGHEGGRRSGTLNVPGIVGFAKALELCLSSLADEQSRMRRLRDRLNDRILQALDGVELNGPVLDNLSPRLANNLNLRFAGVDGQALTLKMRDLAVSSGSACTSANPEPSHVLRALGLKDDAVRSSLRFGLSRFTTEAEIDLASDIVCAAVRSLRQLGETAAGA